VKRAKAFLSGGRPFTDLSKPDRNFLDSLTVLRNALAHESSHAVALFRQEFTLGKALPPQQERPAGYLRGQHASGQTRFNYLLGRTVLVMRTLCR